MTDGTINKPRIATLFGEKDVSTFLGLEACDNLEELSAGLAIIGASCASPYPSVGAYCKEAPQALRAAMAPFASSAVRHNFDVGGELFPEGAKKAVDCGDLAYDETDAEGNRARIEAAVRTILKKGAVPVVLGGDDSIPIPMLSAFEGTGPYTILQLDAHIDWRPSHEGEPMGLSSTMRRASEMPHIERIIQVGARVTGSAHPQDYQDAVDWGVHFVTARDIHAGGADAALKYIPEDSAIIVCVDFDVLDPSLVPGVIGRTPGGLSYFQTLDLIEGAARRGSVAAIDFVEYMPDADIDGIGGLNASRLVASSLGILARQS
ncbi:MAG: arginase family protein [Pseudomonadota bacterium]